MPLVEIQAMNSDRGLPIVIELITFVFVFPLDGRYETRDLDNEMEISVRGGNSTSKREAGVLRVHS